MKQGFLIAVFVVLGALIVAGGAWYVNKNINYKATVASATGSSGAATATTTGASASTSTNSSSSMDGLIIKDIKVGTGTVAQNGDVVTVNYVGTLSDGKVFDSSQAHGQPFSFTLGAGQVIKGWDMGVLGMKVGGVRDLTIPPGLGYGAAGAGNGLIPPNATLHFKITLLSVTNPAAGK